MKPSFSVLSSLFLLPAVIVCGGICDAQPASKSAAKPVKGKGTPDKPKDSSVVSIHGNNAGPIYMCKSLGVFGLTVRATAGKELTRKEQDIVAHGVYQLTGRTHAHLITSKDNIPTPDGRYVGYSYVELTEGPYKGKRGFVFIDHVHK